MKTKRISSKLFKIEEEQTDVVPNFRIEEKTKRTIPKLFRIEQEQRALVLNLLESKKKRTELFHIFQDLRKNEEY